MSNIIIKKELRGYLRNSSLEVSHKMVCPMVKLIKMKYDNVDAKKVAIIANELINERH